MKALDRKTAQKLARLDDALDARTVAAAQEYRDAIEAVEAIDAKMTQIRLELAAVAGELDPTDLAGFAAYGPWSTLQRDRLKKLLDQRLDAEAKAEDLRGKLALAHGEEKAVAWLLDASKVKRRR